MKSIPHFKLKRHHLYIAWSFIGFGILSLALAFVFDPQRAWVNLLINNFYFLSLGLAGLVFLAINYVCKGGWMAVIRRVPEAMSSCLFVAFPIMLVLVLGIHSLYHWSHADAVAHDPILQHKEAYLNTPFFVVRMVIFFSLWMLFAYWMRRASLRQDQEANPKHHQASVRLSVFFLATFAITFSFASYDWLMSVDPHWFSTIFSFYTFSSLFLHGIAAMTLVVILLYEKGYLKGYVNENHFHDLGKYLFAFSTFWAYIWYDQFFLIWYSNIPEESVYFVTRMDSEWIWLFLLNLAINWAIPFLILMSRTAKRSPAILKRVCITLLIGYWLDLFVHVAPSVIPNRQIGPVEVFTALGFAALFFLVTGKALSKAPLIAKNDPYLEESMNLHQ